MRCLKVHAQFYLGEKPLKDIEKLQMEMDDMTFNYEMIIEMIDDGITVDNPVLSLQ